MSRDEKKKEILREVYKWARQASEPPPCCLNRALSKLNALYKIKQEKKCENCIFTKAEKIGKKL